jgi:WD40 repeat protein
MVVTASDDKTAAVWDLMNGTLIKHLTGGHRWFIMSAVILMPTFGTAPFVVTSGWDNYSLVWNLGTGKQVMRLASNYANAVSTVLSFVSPQLQTKLGRNLMESAHVPFILTAGFDKIVTIWDGESGQVLRQYTSKHTDIISSAAVFVPVASEVGLFGITGSFDNTAIVWDLLTGDNVRILEGHSDWIMSVAIFRTNSGKPFFAMGLTGCHDGTAMLWDLVHGIAIRKFEGTHKQPITSVQFLPRFPSQGTSSLSAYDPCVINRADYYPVYETSEKTARKGTAGAAGTSTVSAMHAVGTGKTSRTGQATSSTSIEQSMSDTFPLIVASSEDGTVSLWDLEALQSQPLTRPDISLSPAVAVAEDTTELDEFSGEIKKFSTETRQGLVNPGAKDWIVCLRVFAPTDGRRPIILSGSTTGVATAWDLLSGMMIKEFTGEHVADVSGVDVIESLQAKFVAFAASRKGKKTAVSKTTADPSNASMTECKSAEGAALLVVTGGFDGKVVIWDYDTAEVVQVLTGVHTDSVSCVSASAPYGALEYAFAVSASYDATATVWNLHTGAAAHRLTGGHKEGITSVAIFKPRAVNGERVHPLAITGGIDTLTVIWDLVTGTAIRTLSGTHLERIKSVTSYQPQVGGAVVITGGYDKRAVIWDLETGSVKKILANGHRNWVTSVAVVEPGDGGAPFIVTGGFDAMPIIWDYETGKVISRLEGGHSNGIRALAVYTGVPGDAGRYSPLLFSAGHDGTVVKWDSLYPFQALPPKSTVQKMFEMDCGEAVEKKWPRISALSTRFGDPLWSENSQLFIRACLVRRSDFLERFQDALGVSLGRLGDVVPGKSLLRFALETKDLQSVRVILRCWTQNLNKPILRAMHIKVHASLFLPTSEVLLLGDTYPAEFTAFIASLRLIPVEAGVSISAVVDPVTKSAINGCAMDGLLTPHKLFDAAPAGEATRGVPVSLSYVPLQDAAGMRMLHMYMKTSLILGTVEVFDTDIVIYALRFAWKHSGLRVHTLGVITYCAFFVVYTPTILAFEELRNSENASDRGFAWLLQTASFLGVLMVACFTFRKLRHAAQKGNVLQVFQDGWVVINIACVVFALGGLLARYAAAGECHTSRCLLAVTTILLWMRGLYYLRPYRLSGPLGEFYRCVVCTGQTVSMLAL